MPTDNTGYKDAVGLHNNFVVHNAIGASAEILFMIIDCMKTTMLDIARCIPVLIGYIIMTVLLVNFIKANDDMARLWSAIGCLILLTLTILYNHKVVISVSRSKFYCLVLDAFIIVSIIIIFLTGNDLPILPEWFYPL